jgi:hypothetical protein
VERHRVAACALLACGCACGSGKPKVADDARHVAVAKDGDAKDAAARDAAARDATHDAVRATTGDVQVRVEWPDVPVAARTSPGTTSCGTPRAASVAPTTLWGIPDALVIVDGAPPTTGEVHVRLADCALSPRLAVGASLALDTTVDHPIAVHIAPRYQVTALREPLDASASRTVQLPIAGHTARLPLSAGDIIELTADVKDADPAWIAAGAGAVTDSSGAVLIKGIPVGPHTVHAWLPPRAGQPAHYTEGTVTVEPGDLTTLTLKFSP